MVLVWALAAMMMAANATTLVNTLMIPGSAVDGTPVNGNVNAANVNRLGGFGSDIFYDRSANVFYGLTDRGPGGGTIGYETRVHKFTLDIDRTTGAATNFHLLASIHFMIPAGMTFHGVKGPMAFNGIDPGMDPNGGRNGGTAGRSFDPE